LARVNLLNVNSAGTDQTIAPSAETQRNRPDRTKNVAEFSALMNGNYAKPQANAQSLAVKSQTLELGKNGSQYSYRDNRIEPAKDQTLSDKISNSDTDPKEFADEVVTTVADDLGVDKEEVEEALETLGMTAFDLLIPENLVELTTQITGEESPANLLVNEQFVDLMQDMNQLGLEFIKDFDVQPGELQDMVAQMDILEEPVELTPDEAGVLLNAEDTVVVSEELPKQENTVNTEQTVTTEVAEEAAETTEETLPEVENANGSEDTGSEEESGTFADTRQTKTAADTKNNVEPQIQVAINQPDALPEEMPVPEEVNTSYLNVDTMDIIEQIAENVRVNVSEGTTSMEMQLNPENLGKIYLQISAKEGVVNASITASNEAVRAALEAQVADLRENLNQAGVKVDAIEVTVASHEFERNLEQSAEGEKQQGERNRENSTRRRSISLSSLDELSGVMSEEEALVAQIMRDNGNSVDLTA
jgi:flagellar hook-length control protein FliK